MDTYVKLLVALRQNQVDYLVVGGLAVALNGFERYTEDLDLLLRADPANLSRLLDTLTQVGEGYARELVLADFPLEEGAVRLIEEAFTLDLFTLMSGHTYDDLLPMSFERTYDGYAIRVLNADGLIALKAPSLRPKDQLDVQMLRRLPPRTA